MKYIKTFESYTLNEIKSQHTLTAKSKDIISQVESSLKDGNFYQAELYNKVYMKDGGKRPVQIKKWRKMAWLKNTVDLGSRIEFDYEWVTYTVDKKQVQEKTASDYLNWRLENLFNQMYSNWSQDTSHDWDAQAAGVSGKSGKDEVGATTDAGFIKWFAKKYKVDYKKIINKLTWLSLDDFERAAKANPYK